MSVTDKILLADGRDPADVVAWVMAATGMDDVTIRGDEEYRVEQDQHYVARPARGRPGYLQAVVQKNYLQHREQELTDLAFTDYFPVLVTVFSNGRDRDHLYSEAVNLFIELSGTATTPMALVRGGDNVVVAVFTPAAGIRWMPPGTETTALDRHVWGPLLPEIEAACAGGRYDGGDDHRS